MFRKTGPPTGPTDFSRRQPPQGLDLHAIELTILLQLLNVDYGYASLLPKNPSQ